MDNEANNQSGTKVFQKVLFVIIACGVALGLAYFISKIAFDEMLEKVDRVSTPNEKLRLVSRISRDIIQIDQLQRSQVLGNKRYNGYAEESDFILNSLDTLQSLYRADDFQSARIDSIRILLNDRDKLFDSYVKVRRNLVDNQGFSSQIKNISSLIQSGPQNDNMVITKEKNTTLTLENKQKADDRGFLAKLFGSKSKSQNNDEEETSVPQTVHEEFNVKVDTIKNSQKADTELEIDQAIQNLEVRQKRKSSTFVNHEAELTQAGGILAANMFKILHEVEQEAMQEMEKQNVEARNVVNQSVQRISVILLAFFMISAVFAYFILTDIRKNTAYRVELENAKNEAEYHNAAKQRFLSNMSHELRTPLQSIIGYSEQLKLDNKESEKANIIYQSSEHLLQIVNEVLDYNRIISGNFNFQQDIIDLESLCQEVIRTVKAQADEKNITLNIATRISGQGLVIGDAFRLKQILFNLLGNAIKFTSEGKVVLEVTSTDYGKKADINFRVQDTGSGIPKKDIDKIFDEFEQSTSAGSGVHFGNGLGLSIVKNLVEVMNGDIKVKSIVGHGTTFTVSISLPTSPTTKIDTTSPVELVEPSSFNSTVWLIDDDRFILDLCHTILNKNGIKHVCFQSPGESIDCPVNPDVSHILTDMRMPEMSGRQLYTALRDRYGNEVKIIAFTAQALPEERDEILSLGFDGLLLKPFKEADLLAILGVSGEGATSDGTKVGDIDDEWERVIQLFTKDTEQDLKALNDRVKAEDYEASELLIHRMAGRTAQMGFNKLAFNLKKQEIDIRAGQLPSVTTIDELGRSLRHSIQNLQRKELS